MKMIRIKKKLTGFLIVFLAITLVYQIGRTFFLDQEKQIRTCMYERIRDALPEIWADQKGRFGLFAFQGESLPLKPCENRITTSCVVFIHGLDEPGFIWHQIAPKVKEKGFSVLLFRYPDDQGIDASSRFLFDCLTRVSFQKPIVIICHSMGGLVARQMLADPGFDYASAQKAGRVPEVSDLIMAGTPNHGAILARFRLVMEIREQLLLLTRGQWHWSSAIFDGTGAAAIDLLPDSQFLVHLNNLPNPAGVRLHMIAARIFPFPGNLPRQFTVSRNESLKDFFSQKGNILHSFFDQVGMMAGDGLVTLNSAVLADVPVTVVKANHKTMLAPIFAPGSKTPAAIPVILNILDTINR